MSEQFYKLPLRSARGCLRFTQQIMGGERDEIPNATIPAEEHKRFKNDLDAFMDYLSLMIKTEIAEIEIPDHHKQMYEAVAQVGVLVSLLEGSDFPAKKEGE